MTLDQVIQMADSLKPNAFSTGAKTEWVNECEGMVQTQVMLLAIEEVITYDYASDKDKELLVIAPHSKIYWAYVCAMIDFANGEYDKYANSMQMFNAFFGEYMRWFAKVYRPADTHAGTIEDERFWKGYYLTAYGLAVKHGYKGTESEWVSLVGLHPERKDNPHEVTAEQVGAYTETETDAKIADAVTPVTDGLTALESDVDALKSAADTLSEKASAHYADKANPHGVTAEQVGAYTKTETDDKIAEAVAPVESDVTALEGAVAGKLDKVTGTVRIYPGVYATDSTDGTPQLITATSDLSYIGTGGGYIPLYAPGGQLKTEEPTSDDSAANKGYVDQSTDALKIHGKKIGSVVRIDDAFDADYAKVSCTSSVKKYGKNFVPYPYTDTTKTVNGVTFTDNGDGSITANGTATSNILYELEIDMDMFRLPNGNYFFSGCPSGGGLSAYYLSAANGIGISYTKFIRDLGSGAILNSEGELWKVAIRISSGVTLNNIVFKPQIEPGDAATEYDPYKAPTIYAPDASGKVDIPLYSDTTTLVADGAIITADYTRNTTDVINNIEENRNPYKLIETITLTEATQIIERSSAPDGTVYSFAKVLITVDTPKTDTAAQQNIRLYINDGTLDYYAYYQSLTTYAKRAHFDCAVENGLLKIRIGNGATNYGGENTGVAAMIENANIVFLSAINKIKLKGEATFAVGTIIKIYGVRA